MFWLNRMHARLGRITGTQAIQDGYAIWSMDFTFWKDDSLVAHKRF
jgi:hypothetical protein